MKKGYNLGSNIDMAANIFLFFATYCEILLFFVLS